MLNDELLHKWVNNELSSKELEEFKKRPEYESLTQLYKHTDNFKGPSLNKEEVLENILKSPKLKETGENNKDISESAIFKLPNWVKYSSAAAVLTLFAIFFWPKTNLVEYEIANAQRVEGLLPDGSTFVLNADSKLSYDKNKWHKNRILNLDGEAFFEVKKGEKFIVKSNSGEVEVLGTKFNVRSRDGNLEVSCEEGKVSVKSKSFHVREILGASHAILITSTGEIKKRMDQNANSKSWLNGVTKLRNKNLTEVIEEMERQFDIQIEVKGIDLSILMSCNFQHEDLDLALRTATAPLGIEYQIVNPKKVILSK